MSSEEKLEGDDGQHVNLQQLATEQTKLEHKIEDLEIELEELKLVLSMASKVEPTRPCHRLIGDVFVPHSASEVHNAVDSEHKKVQLLLNSYREQLKILGDRHDNLSRKIRQAVSPSQT